MRIFVTCPFPQHQTKYFNGEQQKRNRKPFHYIAKESLFPFFFSFAFASLFPFSFVLFAKGVRCRDCNKRSHRKAREICSQTVSDQEFISGSILPRNQPRGIQRIVYQRLEHGCSATNSSGVVFVFFFTRKVCSHWSLSLLNAERTKADRKAVTEKKRTLFTSLVVL